MAIITNPDGSYTLTDDTGREPPVTYNPTPSVAAYPPLQAGPSTARFDDSIIRETPNFSAPDQPPLPTPPAPITNLPVAPEPREDTGFYDEIIRTLPPEWQPSLPAPQVAPGVMPDPTSVRPAPAREGVPTDELSLFNKQTAMAEPPSAMDEAMAFEWRNPKARNIWGKQQVPESKTDVPSTPAVKYDESGKVIQVDPNRIEWKTNPATGMKEPVIPPAPPPPKADPANLTGPGTEPTATEATTQKPLELPFPNPKTTGEHMANEVEKAVHAGKFGGSRAEAMLHLSLTQPRPYRPGGVIPEHDELKTFSKQFLEKIPEKYKSAIEEAFRSKAVNAVVEGEKAQYAKILQAQGYQKAADDARSQLVHLDQIKRDQEAKVQASIGQLNNEIANVRKLGKENPSDRYWARKGAFGTFMTKIGVALGELGSAVTGQPNRVAQMVRDEINDEVNFVKQQIESGHASVAEKNSALAQMRASFLSPDAAEHATRALMSEVSLNEIKSLASVSDSYAARKAAMDAMTEISFDAAVHAAKAAEAEAGSRHETYKHYAKQVFGPSGGPRTMPELIKAYRGLGYTPQEALKNIDQNPMFKEKLDPAVQEQVKDAMNRQVIYQNGEILWASQAKIAEKIQKNSSDIEEYIKNTEELRSLAKSGPWEKIKGTAEARRAEVLIARNRFLFKGAINAGEANTAGELDIQDPLVGKKVQDVFQLQSGEDAQLDQVIGTLNSALEAGKKQLYTDPTAAPDTAYSRKKGKLPTGAKKEF